MQRVYQRMAIGLLSLLPLCASAVSLKEVYEEAKLNDPTFQIAYHTWLAAQADPDIALSSLLPQVAFSADRSFSSYNLTSSHSDFSAPSHSLGVTIEQSLFDWGLWKTYRSAKVGQKIALINLRIAAESLIYRSTEAYFNVLTSIQTWQSNKKLHQAYVRQYEQSKHKFDIGTATKADLYDAQAQADNAKSTLITSKAAMDASIADLYVITGKWHNTFKTLTPKLKLNQPQPNNNHAWESLALAQNMSLEASRLAVDQARMNVDVQRANHLPTVSVSGAYTRTSSIATAEDSSSVDGDIRSITFTGSMPIFEGGGTVAAVNQAQENLKTAEATLLQQKRTTIRNAFSYFLNLKASLDAVKASKEALSSSQVALNTTRESYNAGVNTLTDVLFAISTWNTANIGYITARHQYLLDSMLLKQAVGSLDVHDLENVDGLLTKTIHYPDAGRHHHDDKATTQS